MNDKKVMFKVPDREDPYVSIGKYIRDHITVIEDIIAVIELDGVETKELFMAEMEEDDGYFISEYDWWDGENSVVLIDFFPVSEAINANSSPEPKWIPCSERLPEQYGNYLVSIEGEEPDIGTINPNDPRGWSLCDANGFYWASDKMLNVTAWMSLPKPYERE